jgi:filamentous hemagglutinin family protein
MPISMKTAAEQAFVEMAMGWIHSEACELRCAEGEFDRLLAIARRFFVVDRATHRPYCSRGMNASIMTNRTWHAIASIALCLAICAAPGIARAQNITVDGRLSPAQTLLGPNYVIGANLGRQVGSNLFHSFRQFSLTTSKVGSKTVSETATFTPTGSTGSIANIIGRVTGGTASSIDGAIKSTISGANLYLINPSGIMFGPHGTVNISGSFHASTADYIRMSDGARFQATNPDGSTLSAAPPAAFGFLNATPGAITVNGSQLAVKSQQTLGLVGGPVTISNGAYLHAPSGTIHVASAAGTGEVPVDPIQGSAPTLATLGAVSIAGLLTNLDVSDFAGKTSGGSIFIRSGTLTIADGSTLDASNYGSGPGGQISLLGTSQIALSNGATIHSLATAAGRGADITLTTGPEGSISAAAGGFVDAASASVRRSVPTGGAGQLTVTTGTLTMTSGAIFGSDVHGSGNTGPVSITANSIVIDGRAPESSAALTGIRSDTLGGSANAADITVNTGTLTILANGEIVTNTRGAGDAGGGSVTVTGPLSIDATGAQFSTGIGSVVSPGATGNAGEMKITAASLSIIGNTSPLSPLVPASNPFSGVSAQTFGSGIGGNVTLDLGTGPLSMNSGAVISSSTSSTGQGGNIEVTAGNITLSGLGPQITARSTGTGDAGTIMVSALNLKESAGAAISTGADSANGGNIALAVKDFLYLVDSKITTSVNSDIGNGGNILIDPQLLVLDHSQIIAQAVRGHGGNITIFANEFFPSADSLISATSELGISGTVEIIGPRVDLDGSLVVLPSELKNAAAIFRTSCAARGNRPRSSLTEAGRGGLPQDPETTLLAVHLADRDFAPGPHLAAAARHAETTPSRPQLTAVRLAMHCS